MKIHNISINQTTFSFGGHPAFFICFWLFVWTCGNFAYGDYQEAQLSIKVDHIQILNTSKEAFFTMYYIWLSFSAFCLLAIIRELYKITKYLKQ